MKRKRTISAPVFSYGGVKIFQKAGGFTLLELLIVITILGTLAMVIFPRMSSFGAGNMKWTARHLAGLIRHLAQESVSRKKTFRLVYNLENEAYWSEVLGENREFTPTGDPLAPRRVLAKGISFEDVITPQQGKVREGEAFTQFYPVGVEKTWIHLKQGDRIWTLVINPLTGRVKIFEKYVE